MSGAFHLWCVVATVTSTKIEREGWVTGKERKGSHSHNNQAIAIYPNITHVWCLSFMVCCCHGYQHKDKKREGKTEKERKGSHSHNN